MKKELRVKTKQEFQSVLKAKNKLVTPNYIIYYKPNDYDHPRFGISASKKLGNAVIRTTIRRRIRAIIHNIYKREEIAKLDYVIIIRAPFLEKKFIENQLEMSDAFLNIRRKMNEKKI